MRSVLMPTPERALRPAQPLQKLATGGFGRIHPAKLDERWNLTFRLLGQGRLRESRSAFKILDRRGKPLPVSESARSPARFTHRTFVLCVIA